MEAKDFRPQGYKAGALIAGVEIEGPRYWFDEHGPNEAYEKAKSDAINLSNVEGNATIVAFHFEGRSETVFPCVDVILKVDHVFDFQKDALTIHSKATVKEK